MNVLILDHHFRQDIDALVRCNAGHHTIRTLSPFYFATEAERHFPREVWGSDLSVYHADRYAAARAAYRREAFRLTRELFRIYPFDVLISPSDTFFYVRDVIDACHELGVPFIVVQKELGVSAKSLAAHAGELRRWFPFAGDWMTTCSESSKVFWVASGAEPDQVSVVGQPRFDYYPQHAGTPRVSGSQRILFLSYDFDVYDETRGEAQVEGPWKPMHLQTEEVLRELAERNIGRVLFKPHPQQDRETLLQIRERLGSSPGIEFLDGSRDTRELICDADTIIGFQSTALAEAMIAGKRVLYTIWGDRVTSVQHLLLPYHELGASIDVVTTPADLRRRLLEPEWPGLTEAQRAMRRTFVENMLGPIDGRASERVWAGIEKRVEEWRGRRAPGRSEQKSEASFHRQERRTARRRYVTRTAAWAVARVLLPDFGITQRLQQRRNDERDRIIECNEALSRTYGPVRRLVGGSRESLWKAAARLVRRSLMQKLSPQRKPA